MNTTSIDIVSMLEAESVLGLVYADNLFIGHIPTTPRNVVCIFDTPGWSPSLGLTDFDYYRPSFQITVLNTDYLTGKALIDDIMILLHGVHHETWNGTLYMLIECTGDPASLGQDEHQRFQFVCNFNVQRR